MNERPDPPIYDPIYDFVLDDFQRRAIDELDRGHSVLVAAPTGSGKTVVAEHAVAEALARGEKAFYTTPIKALSNQKYHDFVARYGTDRVGLLTGDNTINGEAPIVVMTTEVLRNMIYAASTTLAHLRYVVLDEVHYLQDAYRGPVWEEVIIHLPRSVRLVCLSATVSNADELAEWISTVRGPTAAVIEHQRPVELENLYLVGERSSNQPHLLPVVVGDRPNPEAQKLDEEGHRGPRNTKSKRRPGRRLFTPRRVEVAECLNEASMLPALYFIFSRAACDEAVRQCLDAHLSLTDADERQRIRAICEQHVRTLSDDDLDILGWSSWMTGMEAGIGAHHAGMVPPFKEAVEACFTAGLVKLVFATETLALGINMPARSVVIEKLTKFTGERHEFLTPSQYTQLTGRAGRRGIDEHGNALVLWSPYITFEQVAALVMARSFALSSAFRPTYNMAVNLVRRYPPDEAHHLLNLSFAQYLSDREVVGLEVQLERVAKRRDEAQGHAHCDLGDPQELVMLERRLQELRRKAPSQLHEMEEALARLHPGDIIDVPDRREPVIAVVLSAAKRQGATRLRVLTATKRRLVFGPSDFEIAPQRLGHVDLPTPYAPHSPTYQRSVAALLSRTRLRRSESGRPERDGSGKKTNKVGGKSHSGGLTKLEAAIGEHPVASCPSVDLHRRAVRDANRLADEYDQIKGRVLGHSSTLARSFDRILQVLEELGYLDGWQLSERGNGLARLFHETDLLLAECLNAGLFDDLDPASIAALASLFTYESRGGNDDVVPWLPTAELRKRWAEIEGLRLRVVDLEERVGVPLVRGLDPGFAALAYAWVKGEELIEVLENEELSGGDFVRNVKQLIDLLRQIGDAALVGRTTAAARAASIALFRGIVAASSSVDEEAAGSEADDNSQG
ncbi:MAG: DEAD/DEAH box helicase [Acidimicrobiales bacterium]